MCHYLNYELKIECGGCDFSFLRLSPIGMNKSSWNCSGRGKKSTLTIFVTWEFDKTKIGVKTVSNTYFMCTNLVKDRVWFGLTTLNYIHYKIIYRAILICKLKTNYAFVSHKNWCPDTLNTHIIIKNTSTFDILLFFEILYIEYMKTL